MTFRLLALLAMLAMLDVSSSDDGDVSCHAQTLALLEGGRPPNHPLSVEKIIHRWWLLRGQHHRTDCEMFDALRVEYQGNRTPWGDSRLVDNPVPRHRGDGAATSRMTVVAMVMH